MAFTLPVYQEPVFPPNAGNAAVAPAPADGIAPERFHATSIYPEYFRIDNQWRLAEESRMDCVVTFSDNTLHVTEPRLLRKGDLVILGRTENGEEGIFVHVNPFDSAVNQPESFSFRSGRSRETAFSMDYDNLYSLLLHEKAHGSIVWVMGPAFAFDYDSRNAMQALADHGFVNGLLAGNALATHDLEAGFFGTALGQDIYTQKSVHNGHYHHLDLINMVRHSGSIPAFIQEKNIINGIMYSITKNNIPYVLTGSIRDDGPLPGVEADVYQGQQCMRSIIRKATTIICLATQLHTIATGNMTPCFRKIGGVLRPLYIYTIDISEFAVNKLADRGSLSAISFVTNVQDFVTHLARNLIEK